MNTICFLPLIILDIAKYNEYKARFKNLNQQYKKMIYMLHNGHKVEVEEMKKFASLKQERCICLAFITRIEMYLNNMTAEDKEYIFNKYAVNHDVDISKRTYDIFMNITL